MTDFILGLILLFMLLLITINIVSPIDIKIKNDDNGWKHIMIKSGKEKGKENE